MFTGLIEDIGRIRSRQAVGEGVEFQVSTSLALSDEKLGASIAVNGVCLTVTAMVEGCFTALAARETMKVTGLGDLQVGARVHLERALRVGDPLGGHWVQGHVDGVGVLDGVFQMAESTVLWVRAPRHLLHYFVPKGSICLDGVSLTVNEVVDDLVRVNIIPHTLEKTRFATLLEGSILNIEVDILAKYVERMLTVKGSSSDSELLQTLKKSGYLG